MTLLLALWMLQANGIALENEYVRVMRNEVRCAVAGPACQDRVIVALGNVELQSGKTSRKLSRGQIAVFSAGQSYERPTGTFFEVTIKVGHPPIQSPSEFIPAEKNVVLHDGGKLYIFEERLAVGETRERHSHSQRVVIQLNHTKLQQWPDGQAEVIRDIVPDQAGFNPPVVHKVKNVGELPLRGVVIELRR
jgi:hypothetical protein